MNADVHIRTTIQDFYSYVESAALKVGNTIVEFHHDGLVIHGHGQKQSYDALPLELQDNKGQGHVTIDLQATNKNNKHKTYVSVRVADNLAVLVSFTKRFMAVSIEGDDTSLDGSVGIMGDYYTGAMVGRHGKVWNDFTSFSFDLQVNMDDPKLFQEDRAPQLPYERCRMPDVEVISMRRRLRSHDNDELVQNANAVCQGAVDLDLCVDDVLATGDVDMADHFF